MKTEREAIIQTALSLIDDEGLDRLNMRALASRLDVGTSTLYWHVGDKAELLSLMARTFYDHAYAVAGERGDWRDWLLIFGNAFRMALLSHRDSARLCALARPVRNNGVSDAERMSRSLVAAGLSRPSALSFQASVISLALGWTVYQQSEAMHGPLAGIFDFDTSFDTGLRAMVSGFAD